MKRLKNYVSIFLCAAMIIGIIPFSASAEMLPGLLDLSRQAAAEGIVMLENDDNVLPLKDDEIISVFGRIQIDYFPCGYGSGGDVKYPYITNLITALRQHPDIHVNEDLAAVYDEWCGKNQPNHGSWGNWPTNHAEMPLTDDVVDAAAGSSDTAVVVIGRSAGEDRESSLTKGSYYLTDLEVAMLDKVTAKFDKVVVLLNVGNIIDMSWTNNYAGKISSLLYVWQGGMESGKAVADVLSGDVAPSGKLAATIANTYADYPSAANFGNNEFNNYAEDIYVGYRYFETFAPEKVMYPFGYGIGYTDFEIKTNSVNTIDGEIVVNVSVKNTGSYKGKEVVQIYYGAPQGQLGKAKKSLAAYAKTGLLNPGESQDITLSFAVDSMASYDDIGKRVKSAYILEEGNYPIYVGNSVSTSAKEGEYLQENLKIVDQLTEASAVEPGKGFNRIIAKDDGSGNIVPQLEAVPERTVSLKDRILDNLPAEITQTGDLGYKLIQVYNGEVSLEDFVAQLTVTELAALCRGDGPMGSSLGVPGNAAVYGGVLASLRNKGIVPITTCDGPSGIRMSYAATLLPIGTTLACTWNDLLVESLYAGVGEEMVLNKVDALLAPGMNLQRDPLCGRNFEYFSEDPLITGQMGAALTRGVQSAGASSTPKHYAANNQEVNRNYNDSRVSERALREIYLKGFEICVKTSKPQNIMTSYNKINGVWGHYNYDLCTTILRNEWGFDGVVMTDWWMRESVDPNFPNVSNNAYRVRSQVDLMMPGDQWQSSIEESYSKENGITLGEMQRSAMNVLNYVLISPKFAETNGLPLYDYTPSAPQFTVEQDSPNDPRLSAIMVDGKMIGKFNSLTLDYTIFTKGLATLTEFPAITAEAPAGVNVAITQATPASPVATLKVTSSEVGSLENVYRVYFTDQAGLTPNVDDPIYASIEKIFINGEEMKTFYKELYQYEITVQNVDELVITAQTPDQVDYTVTYYPTYALVRAESPHQAIEYKFYYIKAPQSDDFDGTELKDFWTVKNQNEKLSIGNGFLSIITERGDIYNSGNDLNNYVMQSAGGNWDSITKVEFDKHPFASYHQIGLMIMENEANYLHFRYEYNNWNNQSSHPPVIRVNRETNDSSSTVASNTEFVDRMLENDPNGKQLYFKVSKRGTSYDFSISYDGTNYTIIAEGVTANYAAPKFVLTSLNGNTNPNDTTVSTPEPLQVKYDYVSFDVLGEEASVITIKADESSRIKLGEQYFYMTSELGTENTSDVGGGLNVGWTAGGQYLLYNIEVEKSGYYNITPRIASNAGALEQMSFNIEVDGEILATFIRGGGTNGWQNWISLPSKAVYLEEGSHHLKFYCNTGSFNVNWLRFDPAETYPISVNAEAGATVELVRTEAVPGQTVSFKVNLDENRELETVTASSNGAAISLQSQGAENYSFEMPAGAVEINVTLKSMPKPDTDLLEFVILYAQTEKDNGALNGVMKIIVDKFNEAFDNAVEVLVAAKATHVTVSQQDVDNAAEALLDAIHYLEFKVDKSKLENLVAKVEKYEADKDKYIASTYAAFEEALIKAREVLEDTASMEDDVDNAWNALASATAKLRLKPNKDSLSDLLGKAKMINLSLFSVASVDALEDAIYEAENVIEDDDATQDDVDKSLSLLQSRINDLETIPLGVSDNNNPLNSDQSVADKSANPKTGESSVIPLILMFAASAMYMIIRKKEKR